MTWLTRWRTFLGTVQSPPPRQSASSLPYNLKRLREAKGWSVASLAEKSAVSESTIRAMETGNNYDVPETERRGSGAPTYDPNPTLSTLLAVAQALGVGIEEMVRENV